MGLFSKLPEEPVEWAGLPSEPDRAESDAERLKDAGGVGLDGLGLGAASVESIVIPVPPIIETAPSDESAEDE